MTGALRVSLNLESPTPAYRRLADEGWLELKRRRGATVIAGTRRGQSTTARLMACCGSWHRLPLEPASMFGL